MMKKEGVVWVSTILYTAISLAIIGMLLAVVQPKIAQLKDSIIIEQTKTSLNKIDETLLNTKEAAGMRLYSELKLGKGQLFIDAINDSIKWTYLSSYKYSEINRTFRDIGNIYALTEKVVDKYKLTFKLNYTVNLTINSKDEEKIIQEAPIPYKIWFENKGSYIDIAIE